MANEVTEIEGYGAEGDYVPRRFKVASGVKISKGTVLVLSSPRTATASTGTGDLFAGVAAADKSATDLSTSISAWQNGILEFTASQQILAGEKLQTAAGTGNFVIPLSANTSSLQIVVGYALKDAATNTRVQVRVNN